MLDALAVPESTAGNADGLAVGFVCSWTDGGRDAAWVHVAGELDIAAAPELERTLRGAASQARLVVLDLRELGFIDSCGVHVIVDASIRARRNGRRLLLLRGRPNVDRLFTLTQSSDKVEISDRAPSDPAVEVLLQVAEQRLAF